MSITYHNNGLVSSHQSVGKWFIFVFCGKNILTNLVGYEQHTSLCVKMEFVVGTNLLSCELYSLTWICLRSCGVGTIVYGKWCFVLHVQYCGFAQNIGHSCTRVQFHLQWHLGVSSE